MSQLIRLSQQRKKGNYREETNIVEQLKHPLPDKLTQLNSLPRIMNFDMSIEGTFFIETYRKDDLIRKKHRIHAYQQDVKDDRSGWWKWSSKAVEKKTKDERTFAVPLGFYIPIGTGSWSDDLPFAWILPQNPQNLPPFIKNNSVLYSVFSNIIKGLRVNTTVTTNLEETISMQSEHIAKAEPDVSRQRFQSEVMATAQMISGLNQRPMPQEQKKKPDDQH